MATLFLAVGVMIIFSPFVQMSEGATLGRFPNTSESLAIAPVVITERDGKLRLDWDATAASYAVNALLRLDVVESLNGPRWLTAVLVRALRGAAPGPECDAPLPGPPAGSILPQT